MSTIDKTPRDLAKAAATRAAHLFGAAGGTVGGQQTLTIGRRQPELLERLADPDLLSQVAGDFASVAQPSPDTYVWTLAGSDAEIESTLETEPDALLWTASGTGRHPQYLRVLLSRAPHDLGTEVRLQLALDPQPGVPDGLENLAVGGALLKVLHRTKALLETGEIPTLRHNPAARNGGADHREA